MKTVNRNKIIGYVCGILAAFFWGIHSVIIRFMTTDGISPFLIAGTRLYIGAFTLLIILLLRSLLRKRKVFERLECTRFFWIAAVALGVNFLLFQLGLKYTYASDANLIQNFAPVAVLIVSTVFFVHRIKKFSNTPERWWLTLFVVVVGSIGATLILTNHPDEFLSGEKFTKGVGDLIEFMAMFLFALFIISSNEFGIQNEGKSSLQITFYTLVVAAIPVTLFVPFGEYAALSLEQWGYLGLIGVFSTGVAYALWSKAAQHLSVIPLALNIVYIGIITVLTEDLFLDIDLTWKILAGGALMLIASVAAEVVNSTYNKDTETINSELHTE